MYLTVKQQVKSLSKNDYRNLRELCHIAKNLVNEATYNIRQYFFSEKKYLNYNENYKKLKSSENYRLLNSNMAQQIIRKVDGNFQSFFALLKQVQNGTYMEKCRLPGYLPEDGFSTLIIEMICINGNKLKIPYSNRYRKTHADIYITIPPNLVDKKIKEIQIIPRVNARFFEIQYTYEAEDIKVDLDKQHVLAIDVGVNNLITAVTNKGKSFILDGKRLKSINQWYNKENARLQSIKDKQHFGKGTTNRQARLSLNRYHKVNDIISKAAAYVIHYCVSNQIGTLILGYSPTFQKDARLGKANNQSFVNIPFGSLQNKLTYLCKRYGIELIIQEESYTSKASFWDKDYIPTYDKNKEQNYEFSGKRKHRGLYITSDGKILNADVNGALNIMRKSNVVDLRILYDRGDVDTPVRIRVA